MLTHLQGYFNNNPMSLASFFWCKPEKEQKYRYSIWCREKKTSWITCDMALHMNEQPFDPFRTRCCSICTQKHEPLNHSDMNALSEICKEGNHQDDSAVGKGVNMVDLYPDWQRS